MNKYTAEAFKRIKKAASDYQNEVTDTLLAFRQAEQSARAESKAYKDEEGFYNSRLADQKTKAQNRIQLAENAFAGNVGAELEGLRKDLHQHLTAAPSTQFLDVLGVYERYHLTPSKAEVAAMMEQAAGNTLALRALNVVLDNVNSQYRIDAPDAAKFESDIAELERLADGRIMWAPKGAHHEAVTVWGETPRMLRQESGQYVDSGHKWDNLSILMAESDFEKRIAALDQMAKRWTENVLPSVYDTEVYSGHNGENGETISGAEEYVEDYASTAHAAPIVDTDRAAVSAVRQKARERAEADSQGSKARAQYGV